MIIILHTGHSLFGLIPWFDNDNGKLCKPATAEGMYKEQVPHSSGILIPIPLQKAVGAVIMALALSDYIWKKNGDFYRCFKSAFSVYFISSK